MSLIANKKRKKLSKNKKRNWRKTDINDVEEHMEDVRVQERTGGLAAEKLDDQLFFVDKVVQEAPEVPVKRRRREPKPLKCHALLEPDPNIKPAKISHNIPKEKNILKRKTIRVFNADGTLAVQEPKDASAGRARNRKRRLTKRQERMQKNVADYDVWRGKPTEVIEDEFYLRYTKQAKVKMPKHFYEKPSEVPAIEKPHPGQSFNPTYADHQDLLLTAHNVEVEKVKQQKKLKRALDDKFPSLANAPTEKTWLAEMGRGLNPGSDEESDAEFTTHTKEEMTKLSINPPVRRDNKKTEKQRRKQKAEKEKVKKFKELKLAKSKKNELTSHLKSVKRQVEKREVQLKMRLMAKQALKMKNKDKPKKLGKYKYEEPSLPVKLSSELVSSLRELEPEGDLLQDRYKSMQKRNMIEPRKKTKTVRKYKRKTAEKKGHKEITL